MMIIFRMLLIIMLLGNGAILSMESRKNRSEQIHAILSMERGNERVDIHTTLEMILNIKNDKEKDTSYDNEEKDRSYNDKVELYIKNGGDINVKGNISNDLQDMNLLMVTALYGLPKIMKTLLENNVQLDCVNKDGDTALHLAAKNMRSSLACLLVRAGANKDIQNKNGKTPLDEAKDSPLCFKYRHFSKKNGGYNFCVPRMMNLLRKTPQDNLTASIGTQINHAIAKIDDMEANIPSKRFIAKIDDMEVTLPAKRCIKNNNKYTQNSNECYRKLPSNNYIPNGTVYYSHYPTQMMHPGYHPAQMVNAGYYPMQPMNAGYPQAIYNPNVHEYYSMQMNNMQHYPQQLMHSMHYADVYPTTSDRTTQNYVNLLEWSR